MCPEPDSTRRYGPLLYRRWGRFVRLNLYGLTAGFRVPWGADDAR